MKRKPKCEACGHNHRGQKVYRWVTDTGKVSGIRRSRFCDGRWIGDHMGFPALFPTIVR